MASQAAQAAVTRLKCLVFSAAFRLQVQQQAQQLQQAQAQAQRQKRRFARSNGRESQVAAVVDVAVPNPILVGDVDMKPEGRIAFN